MCEKRDDLAGVANIEELEMTESNRFVGTWKLVSWQVTELDGTIRFPYSKAVVGYLIYTADGYMAAEIMDPDRQQTIPGFPLESAAAQTLPDPDRARAYSTYLSYCGTYTVEGNTVTHHVKAALIPSWTGSEQPRRFTFDDHSLIIEAGNQKLVWERA
ncbi:MAG: lipocalin-like domain-containing protein [Hyphomicrobiales bacterium]